MSPTCTRMFLGVVMPIKDYYLLYQIFLLALLLSSGQIGHCQHSGDTNYQNVTLALATNTTTSATSTTPTTIAPAVSSSDNGGSELILSAEEFVDSREVPMILIDGSANEDSASNTTTAAASENAPSSIETSSTPASATNQNATATTTTSPVTTTKLDGEPNEHDPDELDEDAEDDLDSSRLAPNEPGRGSNFEPPQNISQYMDYIEKLFHDLRHQITHLFEPHLPQLIRTSQMVELTSSCSYDMLRMALALRQFEPWALRMIDSSGKVPEGIFEGSFTALGSYDECLNTVFQSASSHSSSQTERESSGGGSESTYTGATSSSPSDQTTPANTAKQVAAGSTQGKYCLVTVSPFMPPKPPADKVERLFQEEANRRNYTRDDQFSRLSPMFYYMKFRIGVCMPSTCDQTDMDSISSALSSSLRLNITIPDCRVKQTDEQLTNHQLVGGLTFALVAALVVLATLIDCFELKWKQLEIKDIEFIQEAKNANNNADQLQHSDRLNGFGSNKQAVKIKIGQEQQRDKLVPHDNSATCSAARSANRVEKHWTWMSFSLITNFRLHFQPHTRSPTTISSRQNHLSLTDRNSPVAADAGGSGDKAPDQRTCPPNEQRMIACLNGIRVLSLCWIIVANSYLTLDPRATKRLAKTREAPRDFLFQLVVQASLAIETFFFLSGLLMSLSYSRNLRPSSSSSSSRTSGSVWNQHGKHQNQHMHGLQHPSLENQSTRTRRLECLLKWVQFYVHRYVRMTPPTMLVIAFSMYAYHYSDGPLWFEATQKVHQSCAQNWWRHLLHVANFIDTRQMCFIHYWYISADMQLFLFAPVIMFLLFRCRHLGYLLIALVGCTSVGLVFYTTYSRSLPPTLLFYSTDPESRREFGNTIMTKPMTHVLPYLVGMLVGWWAIISNKNETDSSVSSDKQDNTIEAKHNQSRRDSVPMNKISALNGSRVYYPDQLPNKNMRTTGVISNSSKGPFYSASGIFGLLALAVALIEVFLPYKWNNSHLPSRLMAAIYAALFRLGWSLVLAYVVISCRHRPGRQCDLASATQSRPANPNNSNQQPTSSSTANSSTNYCYCGLGGNSINRLLGMTVFTHLSKLSFVAYLIHLPLMSVFIGQTRGLFAFSHTLVLHFAISYLVISFVLSFLLVHFIEFPFVTFERFLFNHLFRCINKPAPNREEPMQQTVKPTKTPDQYLFYPGPLIRPMIRIEDLNQHEPGIVSGGGGFNPAPNQLQRTTAGHQNHRQHHHITTERL